MTSQSAVGFPNGSNKAANRASYQALSKVRRSNSENYVSLDNRVMEWKNELIPDFVAAINQYGECDEHK